ncbi:hypothetical protein DCAR_0623449 [Daucus carota subsp. sativus]|uniref:Uncharacterized protein n=1 Tax=Daucus carota subsp. sativus TaxID=79200 RepID=A0A175YDU6_DAUCS|nr:hypothetical protein DCAR_0623449 [Daucus carota subsp. sativus]
MDSLLTLLPTAKQDWKIRVRISKKWEQLRPSGQVFGISMIFVDENDLRIHAWMKSSIISRLDDSLVECGVFQIENFIVRPYGANERNRCFTGDKRIFLTEATVVMPCLEPHEFIPKHVFDCIPLNTVREHASQDKCLIDVCGIVKDLQPIQQFVSITGKEQIVVKFVLADNNNNTVRATMWNEHALFMHMSLDFTTQRPLIVIISSCKPHLWEGTPTVTNMQATRIFFNSSHPAAATIRAGYGN